MQEFYATMLATSYALALKPGLLSDTLNSRTGTKQRYTSFEDMDLIYEGVGFDNYDWLQVETVRLSVFFVRGQDLAELVKKLQVAFPSGRAMSNEQVFHNLELIRPGITAQAGILAHTDHPEAHCSCRVSLSTSDGRCNRLLRRSKCD